MRPAAPRTPTLTCSPITPSYPKSIGVLPRGNVRKPEQNWERYYSPEQRERFQRSERLLFAMFPEYADEPGE